MKVDEDMILISIYNLQHEDKIFVNDEDFINNTFESAYAAAWAVSLSGRWARSDDYVYFDDSGNLTSFSHWDDVKSPIDIDSLDIDYFIRTIKKNKKREVVNNIPRAIHDALRKDG